jgi:glycosyltransferase involved in cell wall biosynthesis
MVVGLGADSPPAYTRAMQEAFLSQVPQLQHTPYLLYLSRIHEKKGVDLLIKAYSHLFENASKVDGSLPKLVIAGPGLESSYGEEMQKLAHGTYGMERSIFFPGMLSGDAKWGAFYGSEAFILPSHQENFGIAVVEALACGKPVLISNQVNIWCEIISAGAGLVADDTLDATEDMLKRWIAFAHAEKISMGDHAKTCFMKFFAKAPASKRFLEALNSVFNTISN